MGSDPTLPSLTADVGQATERLVVSVNDLEDKTDGRSLTVAAVISLVCMAMGVEADQGVAVTGCLDLRGNVCPVRGLEGKLAGCMARGIRRLLVPASSVEHLDVAALGTDELRRYAQQAVLAYTTLGEALHHVLLGECGG